MTLAVYCVPKKKVPTPTVARRRTPSAHTKRPHGGTIQGSVQARTHVAFGTYFLQQVQGTPTLCWANKQGQLHTVLLIGWHVARNLRGGQTFALACATTILWSSISQSLGGMRLETQDRGPEILSLAKYSASQAAVHLRPRIGQDAVDGGEQRRDEGQGNRECRYYLAD